METLPEMQMSLTIASAPQQSYEWTLYSGWNLISIPHNIQDNSISDVFDDSFPINEILAYDPQIPGGWAVAVRETINEEWQGDLNTLSPLKGYWIFNESNEVPIIMSMPIKSSHP